MSRTGRRHGEVLASFKWALLGVATAVRQERHMRLHLLVAALVVLLGVATRVTALEWALLALAIGFVISLELVNSAMEQALDAVAPERNPLVGRAKDMAAGAVLAAALAAAVIGIAVFYDEFGLF